MEKGVESVLGVTWIAFWITCGTRNASNIDKDM